MMNKIPTTKEEITYKVVETYENLLNDFNNGSITMAQLDYAIKAIIASVGWFIDKDTHSLISNTPITEDDSFTVKRKFISKVTNKVVTIKRHPTRCSVELSQHGFKLPMMLRVGDSVKEGIDIEEKMVSMLINNNFLEI